ncbi:MAG: YabP/YqfC family sporulation protein [Candidatus Improbicoccus devescovinae]|nr:MAG: YabP/YqfC family sporulation protein [Candidatus Improbicoccus devescovinae]
MSKKGKKNLFNMMFDSTIQSEIAPMHFELSGNREARVEGLRKILKYDEKIVKISVKNMSVSFLGRNLKMKCLTHDSLIISGFLSSIEFHT